MYRYKNNTGGEVAKKTTSNHKIKTRTHWYKAKAYTTYLIYNINIHKFNVTIIIHYLFIATFSLQVLNTLFSKFIKRKMTDTALAHIDLVLKFITYLNRNKKPFLCLVNVIYIYLHKQLKLILISTHLLINISSPFLLSSIKSSSNIPSSPLNGIWRFHALPGKGGTTILLSRSNSFLSHSKSLYLRLTLDSLTLNTGKLV